MVDGSRTVLEDSRSADGLLSTWFEGQPTNPTVHSLHHTSSLRHTPSVDFPCKSANSWACPHAAAHAGCVLAGVFWVCPSGYRWAAKQQIEDESLEPSPWQMALTSIQNQVEQDAEPADFCARLLVGGRPAAGMPLTSHIPRAVSL